MDLRNYFSAKPKPKAASAPTAETVCTRLNKNAFMFSPGPTSKMLVPTYPFFAFLRLLSYFATKISGLGASLSLSLWCKYI
jgi:hypothetical protein